MIYVIKGLPFINHLLVHILSAHFNSRASDFFQDWWAEVTNEAKNGGSFSEMMKPIKLTTVDIWVVYFTLHAYMYIDC